MTTFKKFVFPKEYFTRKPEWDYAYDGIRYKFYMYKDVLPLSYARYEDRFYLSIELERLGMRYDQFRDMRFILDTFNGCTEIDKEKLIENCECALKCYNAFMNEEEPEEFETNGLEKNYSPLRKLTTRQIEQLDAFKKVLIGECNKTYFKACVHGYLTSLNDLGVINKKELIELFNMFTKEVTD